MLGSSPAPSLTKPHCSVLCCTLGTVAKPQGPGAQLCLLWSPCQASGSQAAALLRAHKHLSVCKRWVLTRKRSLLSPPDCSALPLSLPWSPKHKSKVFPGGKNIPVLTLAAGAAPFCPAGLGSFSFPPVCSTLSKLCFVLSCLLPPPLPGSLRRAPWLPPSLPAPRSWGRAAACIAQCHRVLAKIREHLVGAFPPPSAGVF